MRETPKSLGTVLVVCGLFGAIASVISLVAYIGVILPTQSGPRQMLEACAVALNLGMAMATVHVGGNLSSILATRPQLPLRVMFFSLLVSALTWHYWVFLLDVYAWFQLRRMSHEVRDTLEAKTLT